MYNILLAKEMADVTPSSSKSSCESFSGTSSCTSPCGLEVEGPPVTFPEVRKEMHYIIAFIDVLAIMMFPQALIVDLLGSSGSHSRIKPLVVGVVSTGECFATGIGRD